MKDNSDLLMTTTQEMIGERCVEMNVRMEKFETDNTYPFNRAYNTSPSGEPQIGGRPQIMAGSYSYLGLGNHPQVKEAVKSAIDTYGGVSHGSRLLMGTTALHKELESELASFIGGESAIIYPNGWMANYGTISTLFNEGDTIITDLRNHNSIHAGVKASGARSIYFNAEKPHTLRRALEKSSGATLVIADAVFSMEGTIIPLPEIIQLCKEYGAMLMLDEAHSIGILGATGRGITEHYGVDPKDVDILMGNTNKAIAGAGGYIVASQKICYALRHHSDSYIFTLSTAPHSIAATLESLRLLKSDPSIVTSLQKKFAYFRKQLSLAGFKTTGTDTPIVPIYYPDEPSVLRATEALLEKGIFIVPAVYPAVPKKSPRLRFCITNSHSYKDLDYMVQSLGKISKQYDIDLTQTT